MAGTAQVTFENAQERLKARHKLAEKATSDPLWMKTIILTLGLGFLILFFVLPLILIFQEAFRKGLTGFLHAFDDRATSHAIWLTVVVALISVPLNTIFGLAAAWLVAQYDFKGKRLISIFIELPLWVSPVIAGLMYVLLFGRQGLLGPWLAGHDVKIIFAVPGIVLGTVFVTFPFVARIVTPQLQALGRAEEEAALTLGASGFQTFLRVTIPKIRWSLFYGVILTNARAFGEFGAVSVLSGHIRNQTNTIPLHIEVLYNEYLFVPAFAVASLLSIIAVITLIIKSIASWRAEQVLKEAAINQSINTHP